MQYKCECEIVHLEGNTRRSDTTFPPVFLVYVFGMASVRAVQVLKGDRLGRFSLEVWVRADHCFGENDVGGGDGINGAVLAPLEKVGVTEFVFKVGVDGGVEQACGLACLAVELAECHGDIVGSFEVGVAEGELGVPGLGVVPQWDVDGGAR